MAALALEGLDAAGDPPEHGGATGLPHVIPSEELIAKVVVRPRHLLWIDESGRLLGIVLFGHFQLAARLGDALLGRNIAWLLDPQVRKVEEGPYTAIFGQLIRELNEREEEGNGDTSPP
jgi:hypothetical protein